MRIELLLIVLEIPHLANTIEKQICATREVDEGPVEAVEVVVGEHLEMTEGTHQTILTKSWLLRGQC
jgi:hypothetical protein